MRGFESASFHGSEWEWFGEGRSVGVFVLKFFCLSFGVVFSVKPWYFVLFFLK